MATYASGMKLTSLRMNNVGTFIKRGRRDTISANSTSTTAVGVLRIDNIECKVGYIYDVQLHCHPISTVGTDNIGVDVRYSTSGVATTSSPILAGGANNQTAGIVLTSFFELNVFVDTTLSLLVSFQRASGSGTCNLYADAGSHATHLRVVAGGIDPGNGGVEV